MWKDLFLDGRVVLSYFRGSFVNIKMANRWLARQSGTRAGAVNPAAPAYSTSSNGKQMNLSDITRTVPHNSLEVFEGLVPHKLLQVCRLE